MIVSAQLLIRRRAASFGVATLLPLLLSWASVSAEDDPAVAQKTPIGQFITVSSPIDDAVFSRVTNAAIKLQNQSAQDGRPAILVLQLESGTSQFHHVQGLAKFLTSAQVSNVTTVAWIPQTVTGPNVLIALACRQIVMHPDAELGDIGRGKPLDPDEQQAALALAQKRHNPKLNSAIVRGMMDQQVQLLRARLRVNQDGKDELETRVVTKEELETLRKTNITIEDVDHTPVKEAGQLVRSREARLGRSTSSSCKRRRRAEPSPNFMVSNARACGNSRPTRKSAKSASSRSMG